jgi:hypothetical protein
VNSVNAYKASQRELDIWVGESHSEPQGNYLAIQLNAKIKFQNFIKETCNPLASLHLLLNPLIL